MRFSPCFQFKKKGSFTNMAKKQETQKKKGGALKRFLIGFCVGLAIVIIGGAALYSSLISNGFFQRRTVALTSENYEVDNMMMSYQFYAQYNSFMSYYGSYASSFGLDTSKSLKSQVCTLTGDNSSWYWYFMDSAVANMKSVLVFCEEANDRGITLDDADYKTINDTIKAMKKEIRQSGSSVSMVYGAGVKVKDIRRAMELEALATKCKNAIVAEYSYAEADYNTYIEENPNALLYYSYLNMTLTTQDGMTEGDITAEMLAEFETKFKAVTTEEEFETVAFDYLRNYAYKDDEKTTDEKIQEEIDGFLKEDTAYSETAFGKWAKSDEGTVNTIYTTLNEEGTALDVYFLLAKPALHDYNSVDVRHILLTAATYGSDDAAKAKAEEILAQWQSGAKTAESFAALAGEYTEDSAKDGLYENVLKGDMVEEFEAWMFEDGRAVGDSGIVKTQYGYHVMYLDGFGMPAWHAEADDALKQARYEDDVAALEEKHVITQDEYALALLDI